MGNVGFSIQILLSTFYLHFLSEICIEVKYKMTGVAGYKLILKHCLPPYFIYSIQCIVTDFSDSVSSCFHL